MGSESHADYGAPRQLLVLSGPRAGERIEVSYSAVIGRSHADIIISDPELSRQHAAIRPVPEGVELDDLGSLNGTWIDEQRITSPTTAHAGAKLRFGITVAEVVVPESEQFNLERQATIAAQTRPRPRPPFAG
jgi:pSer/pThr/pTyr-binding forkhead associated (FHA) protein